MFVGEGATERSSVRILPLIKPDRHADVPLLVVLDLLPLLCLLLPLVLLLLGECDTEDEENNCQTVKCSHCPRILYQTGLIKLCTSSIYFLLEIFAKCSAVLQSAGRGGHVLHGENLKIFPKFWIIIHHNKLWFRLFFQPLKIIFFILSLIAFIDMFTM